MKKQTGFTLLETMAAVSIFVIVIILIGSLFVLAQRSYSKTAVTGELVQNSRVVMDRLARELRQATTLVTAMSSTTPVNGIFFQDGHDTTKITYIYYYLDGTDFKRKHSYFYYAIDPSDYVYYDSVDGTGQAPQEQTIEDRIIGEYFNNIEFTGIDGLITVSFDLNKNQSNFMVDSKIYIRNY